MARIKLADGKEYDARELDYLTIREEWNEYRAGNLLVRTKMATVRIFRVYDDNGEPSFTAEGEPHVIVRSTKHIVAREDPQPQ